MKSISIRENEYQYSDADVINFSEGLVGLPHMQHAVLIPIEGNEPFYWLASDAGPERFVVIDPTVVFSNYDPIPGTKPMALVTVSSDWKKTTVNLRAPIIIDENAGTGRQVLLSDSDYEFAHSLVEE